LAFSNQLSTKLRNKLGFATTFSHFCGKIIQFSQYFLFFWENLGKIMEKSEEIREN
jgi:hypothetical protein